MFQPNAQSARTSRLSHKASVPLSGSRRAAAQVCDTQAEDTSLMPLPRELPTPTELDVACRQMMGLLNQVARRFARRLPAHVELDELVSAGSVGLVTAIRQHHQEPRPVLTRLAERRIRGAILDHLRALDHLTRRQRAAVGAVAKVKQQLQRDGKDASAATVAKILGITEERAERIEGRLASVQHVSADLVDHICSDQDRPEDDSIRRETKQGVVNALKKLPRRLQTLLSLYYFEELTYKQIGSLLGISRSRISQLHAQAIDLLRQHLTAAEAEQEAMQG